jgi:hypothetical protein
MNIREILYKLFSYIFRREIIRDGFRGVLGRDPEEEAKTSYKKSFGRLKVEGVIKDLVGSEEHWQKIQTDMQKI